MVVADASALVAAISDTTMRGVSVADRLSQGAIAPHLVDAELGHALRGLVMRNHITAAEGLESLRWGLRLVGERMEHPPLMARAWELRDNVSFYDALYVALAEVRQLTLLTADARLAGATGLRCRIEVV